MFRPLMLAAALALTGAAPAPVLADGQIALTLSPRTADEALLLELGLALYALQRERRGTAEVRQTGRDNAARLVQQGGGNHGLIVQRGRGHAGTLTQTGGGNAHALFQSGKGTTADVVQGGGAVGLTFVHGF